MQFGQSKINIFHVERRKISLFIIVLPSRTSECYRFTNGNIRSSSTRISRSVDERLVFFFFSFDLKFFVFDELRTKDGNFCCFFFSERKQFRESYIYSDSTDLEFVSGHGSYPVNFKHYTLPTTARFVK